MSQRECESVAIEAGAATLETLLAVDTSALAVDRCAIAAADRRLTRWARRLGGASRLCNRLAWEGLDEPRARLALAFATGGTGMPADPELHRALMEIRRQAVACGRELARRGYLPEHDGWAAGAKPPLIELWVPAVRIAWRRVAHEVDFPVSPAARWDLCSAWIREASIHCELSAFGLFRARLDDSGSQHAEPATPAQDRGPEQRYRDVVTELLQEGLDPLLHAFPVVARLLAGLVHDWATEAATMLQRLGADRDRLTVLLGTEVKELTSVRRSVADRHQGERVQILGFDTGHRVVYKPRSVGAEASYNRLLHWLNERGLEPRQPVIDVVERGGYGWMQFVEPGHFTDSAAVRRYFGVAGGTLCLAWLLNGRDLHRENVIASSAGPVLVDCEMLMHPVEKGARAAAAASCLDTGLLSMYESDRTGVRDVGGYRGAPYDERSTQVRAWAGLGSANLRFALGCRVKRHFYNAVRCGDAIEPPESHRRELLEGFSAAYRFVLEHRAEILDPEGPLSGFLGVRCRVLLRSTHTYAELLYLLAAPQYQRFGVDRSLALEILGRDWLDCAESPPIAPLLAYERRALEALDVPVFFAGAGERWIAAPGVEPVPEYFTKSGMDAVRQRVARMNAKRLQERLDELSWSLENSPRSRFRTPAPESSSDAGPELLLEYARWVGCELLARGGPGEYGRPEPGGEVHTPLEAVSLYSGSAGVAVFLAALGRITREPRWEGAAEEVASSLDGLELRPAIGPLALGAGTGLGSLLHASALLLHLGRSTTSADRLSPLLGAASSRVGSEAEADVVGGLAGCLLGALSVASVLGGGEGDDLALACGERLLTLVARFADHTPEGAFAVAGFAHGLSGIAYALTRLYRRSGDERFLKAATGALERESGFFSAQRGNWRRVLRGPNPPATGPTWMNAWCYGAPGALLARAVLPRTARDRAREAELQAAVQTTRSAPLAHADHLCCGNLGRSDTLLTVGEWHDRDDLRAAALSRIFEVGARARARGCFGLAVTPTKYPVFRVGLFQGLAGIGYEFLRAAAPRELPSLVAFEPPAEG